MGIPEFFAGKNLFLTGASGFVGKCFIEKLLRSCPDVGKIYVLIRSKKGKTPQERWEDIMKNCLFDTLKETNSENLKKVIAIDGDVGELGLGINAKDRQTIIENVHLVYHMAASVRFDDNLNFSIITNVRSTREIIQLTKEVKNLLLYVHVSTAFSNCERNIVEEQVYPTHGDWKEAIMFAEEADQQIVDATTLKYIHPHPNTYTYCKSLAERAVVDMCQGQIPAVIIRPSVVINTLKDPIKGWNDNWNGPVALLVAGGTGLLRISWAKGDVATDFVTVDILGRFVAVATYTKCKNRNTDVTVYNVSKYQDMPITNNDIKEIGKRIVDDVPFSKMVWYPGGTDTNCWYSYYIQVLLFHMLPALFFDLALKIAGKKPMVFKIQRKIYIANTILYYFLSKHIDFVNTTALTLLRNVSLEDKAEFGVEGFEQQTPEEIYDFFKNAAMGTGRLLLKEDFSNIEKNRTQLWRFWLLDRIVKVVSCGLFVWYVFIKHNFIKCILDVLINYYDRL